MRAVVAVQSSGGRGSGASRAARYISERDRDPEREGARPRPLFTDRDGNLTYRKADRFLSKGQGAPGKDDLIHFSVSFLPDDYERLGASGDERKERLREVARAAMEDVKSDLHAGELRWVAGIHLNTDHPHLHILVHKEITDRAAGELRRLGRLPKRLLPYRAPAPDGEARAVEGSIGTRFVGALNRAQQQAELARERAAEEKTEKTIFPEERLLQAARYNPSIAGRALVEEIILRGAEPGPGESPAATNLRAAFRDASLDDPDYRTRPEQADWLNQRSQELRDLYERGATVNGDVLIIPAEEHELASNNDQPFITSFAYALGHFQNRETAHEFHTLARTIAGDTTDPQTEIEVFRHYYDQTRKDAEALAPTLNEMRLLAGEMAKLETRESVEVFADVVSLEERREPQASTLFNTAARKVRLDDERLRFPAGLGVETKERIVRLTIPAIDGLIESGVPRSALALRIDAAIYHKEAPETDDERRAISDFLKAYVDERLKEPETRALNRSASFRQAHGQITAARTPEELNRVAEAFLRHNLERGTALRNGQPANPNETPLSARERQLLFFGRAPEHHTAEMRELRHAWGLSRAERAERVAALKEGRLEPSPTLARMLVELETRRAASALRHYQASILNAEMRNPGKVNLRQLYERLSPYERTYLVEEIEGRKQALARPQAPITPAREPAKEASTYFEQRTTSPHESNAYRDMASPDRLRQEMETLGVEIAATPTHTAPELISTKSVVNGRATETNHRELVVRAAVNRASEPAATVIAAPTASPSVEREISDASLSRWFREVTQAYSAFDSWHREPQEEPPKNSKTLRARHLLGQAIETRARRELAELNYNLAARAGDTFRFEVRDQSSGERREISDFDVRRRAGARGARAASEDDIHATLERRAAEQQVAGRDLALHAETLRELGEMRHALIERLEKAFTTAAREETDANRRAQVVAEKYAGEEKELPAPLLDRGALSELQEKAIGHGLVERIEQFESLRVVLAAEHSQPARTEQETARLAAQLFTARSELAVSEARAARFDQTCHLRQWEIGGERWSLADLDRRIERLTDDAKLLGKYQIHFDPNSRQQAGDGVERLTIIRETAVGRIATEQRERKEEIQEAGKLVEVLARIETHELAWRAQSGRQMPEPLFTRKELERIAANLEVMRDAATLQQLHQFERQFNAYGPLKERRSPEQEAGRALARATMAEMLQRESAERVASFQVRSELQPLRVELSDGSLLTKRLEDTKPNSLAERVLRPLIERGAERELHDTIRAAFAQYREHLLSGHEKNLSYLTAAREIAGLLRAEAKEHTGAEKTTPDFTSKERINIEIYAERLTDPQEREQYLRLARGELVIESASRDSIERASSTDSNRRLARLAHQFLSHGAGRGR